MWESTFPVMAMKATLGRTVDLIKWKSKIRLKDYRLFQVVGKIPMNYYHAYGTDHRCLLRRSSASARKDIMSVDDD